MKKLWNILIAAILCIALGLGFFNFSQGVGTIPPYQAAVLVPASSATGDTLSYNGTVYTRVPAGTAGYVFTTNGSGGVAYWSATVARTLMTSINASALDTGTVLRSLMTSINASALDTGTVATARLGSGSATSSTYLRGDQSWATPSASGGVKSVGMLIAGYDAPAAVKASADYTCNGTASYHDEIMLATAFADYVTNIKQGAIVGIGTFTCNGTINVPPLAGSNLDFSSAAIWNWFDGDNVVVDSWAHQNYYFNQIASMNGLTSSTNISLLAFRPTTTNALVGDVVGYGAIVRVNAMSCNAIATSGKGVGIFLDSRNVSGVEVMEMNDIHIGYIEQPAIGVLALGYTQRHNRVVVEEIREGWGAGATKMRIGANCTENYYYTSTWSWSVTEANGITMSGDNNSVRFVGSAGLNANGAVVLNSGAINNSFSLDFNAANVGITDNSASRTNMFKTDTPVFCRVSANATQNLTNNTATDILFSNNTDDLYNLHNTSTNTERINIKIPGYYTITGQIAVSENSTGFRNLAINGSTDLTLADVNYMPITGDRTVFQVSTITYLAAADYVTLTLWHNGGTTLTSYGTAAAQDRYPVFSVAKLN